MYERAHSGAAGEHALLADLRRLEAALARFEQQMGDAPRTHGATGAEVLAHTGKLLRDEIARVRDLLV